MHIIKSIIFWARRAVKRERKKLTKDNLWGFLNFIKRSEEENETKKLWSKSFEIKEDFFADVLAQRKISAIINCIKLKFALVRQSGSEECALKTKAIFKIEIVIKKWLQKYTRNNFHPSLIDAILIIYLLFDFSLFLLYSEATCFMLWCTFFYCECNRVVCCAWNLFTLHKRSSLDGCCCRCCCCSVEMLLEHLYDWEIIKM